MTLRKLILLIPCLVISLILFISITVQATLTGVCSNCHTIHNSQNSSSVALSGTGVGWDGSGNLIGGNPEPVPYMNLLVTDCVGCHSSSTPLTIITASGNRVPIVFNTAGPPTQMLAGGNFYYVFNNGDEFGHNVRGISAMDATLNLAPGSNFLQFGCGGSCHISLTLPDFDNSGDFNNGCEGCHQSVQHHTNHTAGQQAPSAAGWYRFLSSPPGHFGVGGGGVFGIEDPDWERNATTLIHNTYFGGDGFFPVGPDFFESISAVCAGCHLNFHDDSSSPFLRHPVDVVIPNAGEYGSGKVIDTPYNIDIPVGKPDLASFDPALIENGDMVICVSCHRAHGSPYYKMMRWDYKSTTLATALSGCNTCHTSKN
jgi:hypothetical protein